MSWSPKIKSKKINVLSSAISETVCLILSLKYEKMNRIKKVKKWDQRRMINSTKSISSSLSKWTTTIFLRFDSIWNIPLYCVLKTNWLHWHKHWKIEAIQLSKIYVLHNQHRYDKHICQRQSPKHKQKWRWKWCS